MPLWLRKPSNSWNDMILLRLLTTGKSLVGLKDNANRYSVARGGLLPRFGSKKNPFRASTRPDSVGETSPGCASAEGSPDQLAKSPDDKSNGSNRSYTTPVANSNSTQQAPARPKPAETRSKRLFDWTTLTALIRPKSQRKPIPMFAKPLVQCELSLEGVKVVRNDLSDSDIEIVPAKPPMPVAPPPVRLSEKPAAPAGNAWDRLAERMFGAGKT